MLLRKKLSGKDCEVINFPPYILNSNIGKISLMSWSETRGSSLAALALRGPAKPRVKRTGTPSPDSMASLRLRGPTESSLARTGHAGPAWQGDEDYRQQVAMGSARDLFSISDRITPEDLIITPPL